MQNQQQQKPEGWTPIQDMRTGLNLLGLAAQALSAPSEVFLRTGFGKNYFGIPALLGCIAVPMWMLFFPHGDPRPLWWFWAVYLLMQVRARIETFRMLRRGEHVHTRYNGWPRLSRMFRKKPETWIKGTVEPAFVVLVGVSCLTFSQPLGAFLITSGVSMGIVAGMIEAAAREQAMRMNDALIEQQNLAERFRDIQNGRRH